MTSGIVSKLISEIADSQEANRAEQYAMVNIRPGEKISAMLDLLVDLTGKSPSSIIGGADLSAQIAKYARSSTKRIEPILDAAGMVVAEQGRFASDSAFGILEQDGVIKLRDTHLERLFKGKT